MAEACKRPIKNWVFLTKTAKGQFVAKLGQAAPLYCRVSTADQT
jgi:hypothetical protein